MGEVWAKKTNLHPLHWWNVLLQELAFSHLPLQARNPESRLQAATFTLNMDEHDSNFDRTYSVEILSNVGDIVLVIGLGLSRSLKTFHRFDTLVQAALHDCQLPCQLQGVNIEQFQLPRCLRLYRWRRSWQWSGSHGHLGLGVVALDPNVRDAGPYQWETRTERSINVNKPLAAANW